MSKPFFAIASAIVCAAASGAAFRVAPGDSIQAAIEKARAATNGPNEIVFAPGEYFIDKTIALGVLDSGLTLRAEKPGEAILYGGTKVTGWRDEGNGVWAAEIPGSKTGERDFRCLVADGRLAERAVWPGGTNKLENTGVWKVQLLASLAGSWARKPTKEELCTMPYRKGDLPPGFEPANAEVHCWHMWNDSVVPVASNDAENAILYFKTPASWPAGACDKRSYVVYNIREGLKEPGQWCLDRTVGKLLYRPLPGEDMAKISIVAPSLETIMAIKGTRKKTVSGVTVTGLVFQCTTPAYASSGFGACSVKPAVDIAWVEGCSFDGIGLLNLGGGGLSLDNADNCRISGSRFENTGAYGIRMDANACEISGCTIRHAGRMFSGACGVRFKGKGCKFLRNEISDIPYCGVIMGGSWNLFEENLVCRVMRVMNDGAAFYGSVNDSIIRGNVVRDVVQQGKGFGASAYYVDEGGCNVTVERNVAEGVPTPVHFHMAYGIKVRDNFFIADKNMNISFARTLAGEFERNTLVLGGEVKMNYPNAISVWRDNRIFRPESPNDPASRWLIGNWTPDNPPMKPRGLVKSAVVPEGKNPPVLDGDTGASEWPGDKWYDVERDATGRRLGGAPVFIRFAHDAKYLYIAMQVSTFRHVETSKGHEWGKDDSAEIRLGPVRIRAFADGTVECSDPALIEGAPRYAGKKKNKKSIINNILLYGIRLPLDKVKAWRDAKGIVPFNACAHSSAFGTTHWYDAQEDGAAPNAKLKIAD